MPTPIRSLPVRLLVAALLLLGGLAVVQSPARADDTVAPNPDPDLIARWEPCQPGTGVTEIIDFQALGDTSVYVGCASGYQADGLDALHAAGFTTAGTQHDGDGFVCRINDLPSPAVEPCTSTPGYGNYWSYWIADAAGSGWAYSGYGATNPESNGTKWPFQAWSFGGGTPRIAAMDARGPLAAAPVPAPRSADAVSMAQAWLTNRLNDDTGTAAGWFGAPYAATPVADLLTSGVAAADLGPALEAIRSVETAVADPSWQADGSSFATVSAASLILTLAAAKDPQDDDEIAALAQALLATVGPTGGSYPGVFPSSVRGDPATLMYYHTAPERNFVQARAIRALLAAGLPVPAASVQLLIANTCADGASSVFCTPEEVRALRALQSAGDSAVDGGTLDRTGLQAALDRAGTYARAQTQETDGGYVGAYPVAKSAGYETAWATAQVAQLLALTGHAAPARRANRFLAGLQLTPGTVGEGPGAGDVGLVEADGLSLNHAVLTGPYPSDRSYDVGIPETAAAIVAWQAAPYVDPTVGSVTPSALGTTYATVSVPVTAGSEDLTPEAVVGTEPSLADGSTTAVAGDTVAAGGSGTVTIKLADLKPSTIYYARVDVAGDGLGTRHSEVVSFTTSPVTATGAQASVPRAVGYLTSSANLVGGSHYELYGSPDVGLSIDGALALAAAGASGVGTGDAALRSIYEWALTAAPAWTGAGTAYPIGGAIGKAALLAEVLKQDPRSFAGLDLIAALDGAVCTAVSTSDSGQRCPVVGAYSYGSSVFSQALGVIAQERAGDAAGAAAPIGYLESLQAADGSWPSLIPATGDADADSTAIAAMALALVADNDSDGTARAAVTKALAWLADQQLGDGAFPGTSGQSTNSTGLAIQALRLVGDTYDTQIAAGQAFLASQQNGDGGFNVANGLSGSDVRASTQTLNGILLTSYGTLSYQLPAKSTTPPPTPTSTSPVATSMKVKVNHHRVKPGGLIKVKGRLTPATAGGKVQLQVKVGRKWKKVAAAKLEHGTFVFKLRERKAGVAKLRVVYSGAAGYQAITSKTIKVRVRR